MKENAARQQPPASPASLPILPPPPGRLARLKDDLRARIGKRIAKDPNPRVERLSDFAELLRKELIHLEPEQIQKNLRLEVTIAETALETCRKKLKDNPKSTYLQNKVTEYTAEVAKRKADLKTPNPETEKKRQQIKQALTVVKWLEPVIGSDAEVRGDGLLDYRSWPLYQDLVKNAVELYEAQRARIKKGFSDIHEKSSDVIANKLLEKWGHLQFRQGDLHKQVTDHIQHLLDHIAATFANDPGQPSTRSVRDTEPAPGAGSLPLLEVLRGPNESSPPTAEHVSDDAKKIIFDTVAEFKKELARAVESLEKTPGEWEKTVEDVHKKAQGILGENGFEKRPTVLTEKNKKDKNVPLINNLYDAVNECDVGPDSYSDDKDALNSYEEILKKIREIIPDTAEQTPPQPTAPPPTPAPVGPSAEDLTKLEEAAAELRRTHQDLAEFTGNLALILNVPSQDNTAETRRAIETQAFRLSLIDNTIQNLSTNLNTSNKRAKDLLSFLGSIAQALKIDPDKLDEAQLISQIGEKLTLQIQALDEAQKLQADTKAAVAQAEEKISKLEQNIKNIGTWIDDYIKKFKGNPEDLPDLQKKIIWVYEHIKILSETTAAAEERSEELEEINRADIASFETANTHLSAAAKALNIDLSTLDGLDFPPRVELLAQKVDEGIAEKLQALEEAQKFQSDAQAAATEAQDKISRLEAALTDSNRYFDDLAKRLEELTNAYIQQLGGKPEKFTSLTAKAAWAAKRAKYLSETAAAVEEIRAEGDPFKRITKGTLTESGISEKVAIPKSNDEQRIEEAPLDSLFEADGSSKFQTAESAKKNRNLIGIDTWAPIPADLQSIVDGIADRAESKLLAIKELNNIEKRNTAQIKAQDDVLAAQAVFINTAQEFLKEYQETLADPAMDKDIRVKWATEKIKELGDAKKELQSAEKALKEYGLVSVRPYLNPEEIIELVKNIAVVLDEQAAQQRRIDALTTTQETTAEELAVLYENLRDMHNYTAGLETKLEAANKATKEGWGQVAELEVALQTETARNVVLQTQMQDLGTQMKNALEVVEKDTLRIQQLEQALEVLGAEKETLASELATTEAALKGKTADAAKLEDSLQEANAQLAAAKEQDQEETDLQDRVQALEKEVETVHQALKTAQLERDEKMRAFLELDQKYLTMESERNRYARGFLSVQGIIILAYASKLLPSGPNKGAINDPILDLLDTVLKAPYQDTDAFHRIIKEQKLSAHTLNAAENFLIDLLKKAKPAVNKKGHLFTLDLIQKHWASFAKQADEFPSEVLEVDGVDIKEEETPPTPPPFNKDRLEAEDAAPAADLNLWGHPKEAGAVDMQTTFAKFEGRNPSPSAQDKTDPFGMSFEEAFIRKYWLEPNTDDSKSKLSTLVEACEKNELTLQRILEKATSIWEGGSGKPAESTALQELIEEISELLSPSPKLKPAPEHKSKETLKEILDTVYKKHKTALNKEGITDKNKSLVIEFICRLKAAEKQINSILLTEKNSEKTPEEKEKLRKKLWKEKAEKLSNGQNHKVLNKLLERTKDFIKITFASSAQGVQFKALQDMQDALTVINPSVFATHDEPEGQGAPATPGNEHSKKSSASPPQNPPAVPSDEKLQEDLKSFYVQQEGNLNQQGILPENQEGIIKFVVSLKEAGQKLNRYPDARKEAALVKLVTNILNKKTPDDIRRYLELSKKLIVAARLFEVISEGLRDSLTHTHTAIRKVTEALSGSEDLTQHPLYYRSIRYIGSLTAESIPADGAIPGAFTDFKEYLQEAAVSEEGSPPFTPNQPVITLEIALQILEAKDPGLQLGVELSKERVEEMKIWVRKLISYAGNLPAAAPTPAHKAPGTAPA